MNTVVTLCRSVPSARFLTAFLLTWAACGCGGCVQTHRKETGARGDITPLTKVWELAMPSVAVPIGIPGLRAEGCGVCHEAIYREWRLSAHAQAFTDLQFQAEWEKDNRLWLCLNCHTPLMNQQERTVTGTFAGDVRRPALYSNPDFDPALRAEGITCAVCHVRDTVVIGPFGGTVAPHPTRRSNELLSVDACGRCHNVAGRFSPELVCMFTTVDEWRDTEAARHGQTCQTCHMEPVMRPLVVDGPVRSGRRHSWPGAGIAKTLKDTAAVMAAYRRGFGIEVNLQKTTGDGLQVLITIADTAAGHDLPTGDVERFLRVTARAIDTGGRVLKSHSERIGETWRWYPEARRVADNSLRPGERRRIVWELPRGIAHEVAEIEVLVTNHRMTEENARLEGLVGRYPLSAEVYRQRFAWNPLGSERVK